MAAVKALRERWIDRRATLQAIHRAFAVAGVKFIDENGGGPGVAEIRSWGTRDDLSLSTSNLHGGSLGPGQKLID
jgi:hypothetical protein